jgi:hypothetical protein
MIYDIMAQRLVDAEIAEVDFREDSTGFPTLTCGTAQLAFAADRQSSMSLLRTATVVLRSFS